MIITHRENAQAILPEDRKAQFKIEAYGNLILTRNKTAITLDFDENDSVHLDGFRVVGLWKTKFQNLPVLGRIARFLRFAGHVWRFCK